MAISQQNLAPVTSQENAEIFYKVMMANDLSGLKPEERVRHIANVCESLGLNPLTKPIQLHKFQGKEVMYMSKDGAEQLRNIHNVSIVKLETEILKNDLYVVRAYASKPNGRQDCSTSALSIANLKGDAIGNAMKKCETQAKRRVTLSICGLGMLDESELENLPRDEKHIAPTVVLSHKETKDEVVEVFGEETLKIAIETINACQNEDELRKAFTMAYKDKMISSNPKARNELVAAKDSKKKELERNEFLEQYDGVTGEIIEDVAS